MSATQGTGTFSVTGASVAAGDTCSHTVNITSSQAASYTNTPGSFIDDQRDSIAIPTAQITVANVPPTVSDAFGAPSVKDGSSTTLGFAITNPSANEMLTNVGFSDLLPSDLTISTPNGISASCPSTSISGTFVPQGAGTVTLSAPRSPPATPARTPPTSPERKPGVSPTSPETSPTTKTTQPPSRRRRSR